MGVQQSAAPPGDEKAGKGGSTEQLSKLGGVLLGLGLLIGALNNQSVKLSNQILPELQAPGVLVARILVGLVGAVLVLWGLAGLLDAEGHLRDFRAWRARRRAPRPPGEKVGRPPDRNRLFSDREADLDRLAKQLARDKRVNLSGLGGVGKSQLAIEYLHRQQYPDGVFWLRGETAATLTGDFAALAWLPQLELEERHLPEQERVVAAVTNWLRARDAWLLVVDNLGEKVIPAFNGLLAPGLTGHVLVTSRVPVWQAPLTVNPMPLKEATDFLIDRTHQTDRGQRPPWQRH
jgi:hypothetical protein